MQCASCGGALEFTTGWAHARCLQCATLYANQNGVYHQLAFTPPGAPRDPAKENAYAASVGFRPREVAPGDEPLDVYQQALPPAEQLQARINQVSSATHVHPSAWRDDFGPLGRDRIEEFAYQMFEVEAEAGGALKRDEIVRKLGYRDLVHFERVRYTFLKHGGRPMGGTLSTFVWDHGPAQPALLAARARKDREQMSAHVEQNKDLLAPVEGVSLGDYAKACMGAASGDFAAALSQLGMDTAKFERVSAAWNAKMGSDTTGTLARLYAEAFTRG
jgi:hypothetical protein